MPAGGVSPVRAATSAGGRGLGGAQALARHVQLVHLDAARAALGAGGGDGGGAQDVQLVGLDGGQVELSVGPRRRDQLEPAHGHGDQGPAGEAEHIGVRELPHFAVGLRDPETAGVGRAVAPDLGLLHPGPVQGVPQVPDGAYPGAPGARGGESVLHLHAVVPVVHEPGGGQVEGGFVPLEHLVHVEGAGPFKAVHQRFVHQRGRHAQGLADGLRRSFKAEVVNEDAPAAVAVVEAQIDVVQIGQVHAHELRQRDQDLLPFPRRVHEPVDRKLLLLPGSVAQADLEDFPASLAFEVEREIPETARVEAFHRHAPSAPSAGHDVVADAQMFALLFVQVGGTGVENTSLLVFEGEGFRRHFVEVGDHVDALRGPRRPDGDRAQGQEKEAEAF